MVAMGGVEAAYLGLSKLDVTLLRHITFREHVGVS